MCHRLLLLYVLSRKMFGEEKKVIPRPVLLTFFDLLLEHATTWLFGLYEVLVRNMIHRPMKSLSKKHDSLAEQKSK